MPDTALAGTLSTRGAGQNPDAVVRARVTQHVGADANAVAAPSGPESAVDPDQRVLQVNPGHAVVAPGRQGLLDLRP